MKIMASPVLQLAIFTFCLVAGSFAARPLWSQDTPSSQCSPSPKISFANAHNNWQLTAIDPESQIDTVDPTIRAERNAYWKPPLQQARDWAKGRYAGPPLGAYSADFPEFPSRKGAVWALADFESFHVIAIDPDRQLIYTEMNFRIEQVFKQPSSLLVSSGSLVDADIPGGCVKLPDGNVSSWQVWPQKYSFQLGHKYLVQFVYQMPGDFFWAEKRWDLSSGKVQPDDPMEIYRAAHGKSSIDGMSVPDLFRYLSLQYVLPDEPEQ